MGKSLSNNDHQKLWLSSELVRIERGEVFVEIRPFEFEKIGTQKNTI